MADTVNATNTKTTGSKPEQWKLVAVLAVVLILLIAFGGGSDDTEESAELSPVSTTGQFTSEVPNASSSQREVHWPVVPLEFLLTHNPFQPDVSRLLTGAADAPIAEDSGTQGDDFVGPSDSSESADSEAGLTATAPKAAISLSAKKVQMIFRSARGAAAMIDDRVYHLGDQISDYVITSIAREGVTLRPAGDSRTSSSGTESAP